MRIGSYKLHFLDILIIFVVLVVITMLFWLRISRKTQWITVRMIISNDEWWWEGSPPQWWLGDSLSVGQTARNSLGETIAQIDDVENFDIGEFYRRTSVDIKLRGTYDQRRQLYLFNYQPIQAGKSLDLTFGKTNVHGVITYIENLPDSYQDKTIVVKMSAVRPWIAQSYKEGMEMKDSLHRTLAKITAVSVSPTEATEIIEGVTGKSSATQNGTERKYPPSLFRDVTLTVSLKTYESGGIQYFLDRAAIKIGEKIWFQFPQTIAREAEIIQILN